MLTRVAIRLIERGYVPDSWTRSAVRRLCARRLEKELVQGDAARREQLERFLGDMDGGPIALLPEVANEQHYEVPASFFDLTLGRRRKYSCCHWPQGVSTLDAAEESALRMTCERARLADGQRILELGRAAIHQCFLEP